MRWCVHGLVHCYWYSGMVIGWYAGALWFVCCLTVLLRVTGLVIWSAGSLTGRCVNGLPGLLLICWYVDDVFGP